MRARKIIFVNRFYAPDYSATAQLLTDLAEKVDLAGVEVHVVTSRLDYLGGTLDRARRERLNGVRVHRIWTSRFGRGTLLGRSFDYFSFYLSGFVSLLSLAGRNDLIVAKTDPPLISIVAAIVARLKRSRLVNWLQDLFPEVAVELGIGVSNQLVFRVTRSMRNWSLHAADQNVVLGSMMGRRLRSQGIPASRILSISNWAVGRDLRPVARNDNPLIREWGLERPLIVGYSGNLGLAHDYSTILGTLRQLENNSNINFVFVGGGAGMRELRKKAEQERLSNILFKPYQPLERLAESLSVPDVHLVALEPRMEGLIVPSKIYGIVAVERPIAFIGSTDGEVGSLVLGEKLGCVVVPGDSTGLSAVLGRWAREPLELEEIRRNVRTHRREHYVQGGPIAKWHSLFSTLIRPSQPQSLART